MSFLDIVSSLHLVCLAAAALIGLYNTSCRIPSVYRIISGILIHDENNTITRFLMSVRVIN